MTAEFMLSKPGECGYTLTIGEEEKSSQIRNFRKQAADESLYYVLRKMALELTV